MEDDIHDPVQAVFDVPMGAHGGGEAFCGELCGREEVAPFDRCFSVALDLGLDHGDHVEVLEAPLSGEAPVAFQPVDPVADGVSSGFDAAMRPVEGVVAFAGVDFGVGKKALDLGAESRPVVLEGQQVVRALVADCSGDPGLAALGHLPGLARIIERGKMVEQTGCGHLRPHRVGAS